MPLDVGARITRETQRAISAKTEHGRRTNAALA